MSDGICYFAAHQDKLGARYCWESDWGDGDRGVSGQDHDKGEQTAGATT